MSVLSHSAALRIDDGPGDLWAGVAQVVDAVEAELDELVTGVEDRVLGPIWATNSVPSPALHEAARRGISAAVRDALARMRSRTELPQELLPDMIELARLCAGSRLELPQFPDPWLVGQEVFWDRFQVVAEQTLGDTALCWDVTKAAQARLRGHAVRLSRLFLNAWERELERVAGVDEHSRLPAVLRALDGQWVEPGELGYDLAGHHVAVVGDAAPLLEATADRTERQLLQVPAPGGGTWGWLGGATRMSEDDLDAVIASQSVPDATVAFGEPAEGIAGFAASHHQAVEARAIGVATKQPAVRFGDFRVLIAVLRDSDLARGFVERELGGLGGPGERMGELRETLRAYLEHSQSVSATAVLRRRDRKTIERQLRSAEQLIRHRVSDRSDEVLIALRVADVLQHGA